MNGCRGAENAGDRHLGLREEPPMPVLVGETCYEGHMQQGFGDVQRHMFWMNMLSGAAGHTYGAAGIWHAGVEGDPGIGGAWSRQLYDWTTWKEGMNYPGRHPTGDRQETAGAVSVVALRAASGMGAGLLSPPAFRAKCVSSTSRGAISTTGTARRSRILSPMSIGMSTTSIRRRAGSSTRARSRPRRRPATRRRSPSLQEECSVPAGLGAGD